MTEIREKINSREAIANWENEGGALKSVFVIQKNDHLILIWVGVLISLPIFYWLWKR